MMGDFESRYTQILQYFREYRADGIILQNLKFCDIWTNEIVVLQSRLRREGIHVLKLERDYRFASEGQVKTRVQAFLESMGK